MGRRTVENPDLAHRAEAPGLTTRIREMEEQGYTVLEHAISPQFADEVRAATIRALLAASVLLHELDALSRPRVRAADPKSPASMTLWSTPRWAAARSSRRSARSARGPGAGVIPIHTDYAHVPEPYPEFAMTGVGVWALEDWRSYPVRPGSCREVTKCAVRHDPAKVTTRPCRSDAERLRRLLHPWRLALAGRPHRSRATG